MSEENVVAELRATNERLDRVIALLEANMETPENQQIKYKLLQEMFWGGQKS
jgi:hypothetical protein